MLSVQHTNFWNPDPRVLPITPVTAQPLNSPLINTPAVPQQSPRRTREKKQDHAHQLYGGVIVTEDVAEDEHARPRKRQKRRKSDPVEEGSDEGSKKQRGRPRLDPRDETALDRRRTQIRLAQRAYRNRKETTIASLKQKVDDIRSTLQTMNQTFDGLYNGLLANNTANPGLLEQLESLKRGFALISNMETDAVDQEDDLTVVQSKKKGSPPVTGREPRSSSPAQIVPDQPLAAGPTQETPPVVENAGAAIDNEQTLVAKDPMGHSCTESYFEYQPEISQQLTQQREHSPWDFSQSLTLHRAFPVHAPVTFSFQETTFARRLHRRTVERGFQGLINPNLNPEWLAHKFRFAFTFATREALAGKFESSLQRGAGEDLEDWLSPYFHIGGAGTHFPRRDAMGKPVFPPNLVDPLTAGGLWELLDPAAATSPNVMADMLEQLGYGGDWFDAHDLEEYLKTKGIYLDGQSSFCHVNIAGITLPRASMSITTGSSSSATTPTTPRSRPLIQSVGPDAGFTYPAGPVQALNLRNNTLDGFDPVGDWSDAFNTASKRAPVSMPLPRSTVSAVSTQQDLLRSEGIISLDMERFIERVISGAVCLGRAPGFGRAAVDHALMLAVEEAL